MAPAAFDAQMAAAVGETSLPRPERFFARMLLVRRFELRILELFGAGELSGTTHCAVGQEANAVAVMVKPLSNEGLKNWRKPPCAEGF